MHYSRLGRLTWMHPFLLGFIFCIMSKETFYFSHDYNSRSDIKIKKLLAKLGYSGYGIYWAIIEDLYQNANAMPLDYDCIAFDMHVKSDMIESIVNDFDLFILNAESFGSMSVQRRMDERDAKSRKARESALYRWNKSETNANAMQTHTECNAKKESKVKESKVKETIKTWKTDYQIYLSESRVAYKELLQDKDFIKKIIHAFPSMNVIKSIENSFVLYWSTDDGWKRKIKAKGNLINWKTTIQNSIKINAVYNQKSDVENTQVQQKSEIYPSLSK